MWLGRLLVFCPHPNQTAQAAGKWYWPARPLPDRAGFQVASGYLKA
ncbi:hypothetical protein HMPREF9371_2041 [Neisseria shayeganii 871]|uniref:Uncharacterized protein n=1 Tax=Neisseria shayeganii 871 TaxID=1032488 RepID=G4CKA1_9NEIS|nr:hypothetical protein HMPREF9371_2041 [Neisseria shayeganii 871]